MYNAALHAEFLHDHSGYGFDVETKGFNWRQLKEKRDAYIVRLNGASSSSILFYSI
jgi:glutathione reductase (NADPH)